MQRNKQKLEIKPKARHDRSQHIHWSWNENQKQQIQKVGKRNREKGRRKLTVVEGNEALVGDLELERIVEGGGVVEHRHVGYVDGAHRIYLSLPFLFDQSLIYLSLPLSRARSLNLVSIPTGIN